MHQTVEGVHMLTQGVGQSGQMIIVRHVDLQQGWHRVQLLDHPPGEAHRPPEVRDDHLGTFGLSDPGDMEANGGIQRDPRHQDVLALQDSHSHSSQ
jgi:hypothetical protein